MGYSADFYKLEVDNVLTFMFSISGSSAREHFENVNSFDEINSIFVELKNDYDTWTSEHWANPWKTSKITDDVIVFEEVKRKWFQFWKPKTSIRIWVKTYYGDDIIRKDENKMWFSTIDELNKNNNSDIDEEENFIFNDLKLFNLPVMK